MVAVGLSCGGCLSCDEEDPCIIAADNFNRADNFGDINDGAPFEWGGATSDHWISGNQLWIVSGTADKLTCPNPHPDSVESGYVYAAFTADIDDEVEVWLSGTSASTCLVAQLTIGTSKTLKIIRRTSGSDTTLATVTATSAFYDDVGVALYYDAVKKVAKAVTDSASVCAYGVDPNGGYLAGIAIGDNSGEVYVDNFTYKRLGDGENGCPELTGCEFNPCLGSVSAWEAVVTISGVTNATCTDCTNLNDTFVVPLVSDGTSLKSWNLDYTASDICAPSGSGISVYADIWCSSGVGTSLGVPGTPLQYGIRVFIQVNISGFHTTWALNKQSATPIDLLETYSGFTLHFFNNPGAWCSHGGIAVTVSFA